MNETEKSFRERNNAEHNRVFSIMGMHTILMVIGLGMSIFVAVSLGDLIKDVQTQHIQTVGMFSSDSARVDSLEVRVNILEKEILKK
jgi:D-alanyl-lipoteichoic acid acyltransferase DltB (MBOAT superfamily)